MIIIKRKNKKGVVRVIEAIISVMLIAIVVLLLYPKTTASNAQKENTEAIINSGKGIIEQMNNNQELREELIMMSSTNTPSNKVKSFIELRIKPGLDYELRVCEMNDVCGPAQYREEVYASEGIISSTLKQYTPKKIKLFQWPKT